ncbi:MAG: hypothetical protein U0269_32750 [Polyangiales bacterium]
MTRTGVSVVIPIESIETPHERIPEGELAEIVFNRWARIHTRNRVRRAAYDPIFVGGYLDSQAKGALAVGAWGVRDNALRYVFDDALGRARVYAIACAHFMSVSIAVMLLEDNFERSMRFGGWRFSPPFSAMELMNNCDAPLVELRGSLYAITAPASDKAPPTILSPHPLKALTFDQLLEDEQRAVVRAWESRECQCQLCEYYRPRAPKYLAKRDERVAREAKKAADAKAKADRAPKKKATKK